MGIAITQQSVESARPLRGFTVIELLVCCAVMTVLMALTIPAILTCRDAAMRVACKNRFRQLGIATNSYASFFNRFPVNEPCTWPITIGPYLEDPVLMDADSQNKRQVSATSLTCPLDDRLVVNGDAVSNMALNPQVVGSPNAALRRGWSQTILFAETESLFGATWITGPLAFPAAVRSSHGNPHVVMADGSVRTILIDDDEILTSLLPE